PRSTRFAPLPDSCGTTRLPPADSCAPRRCASTRVRRAVPWTQDNLSAFVQATGGALPARPPRRVRAGVQLVVVGDLPHVIVEIPAVRVFDVGDRGECRLHHAAFLFGGGRSVRAEYGHRHITGVAIEDREAERFGVLGIPRRRSRQLAELTKCHERSE